MQQSNNSKPKYTTLYIVRHGQSETNVFFENNQSIIDLPPENPLGSSLTSLGVQQAESVAKTLNNIHFDAIFSSHLNRAKQTAEIIAKERKLIVLTKEALQERMKGNLSPEKLKELGDKVNFLYGNPSELSDKEMWKYKSYPEMESAEEALIRFITILREVAVAYEGKTVLIVSHGNVMRNFLVHLGYGTFKELPARSLENTGYYIVESDGVDFFLKEVHLPRDPNW